MNLANNIVIDVYSIMLLIIICFHSFKQNDKESLQFKLFMGMVAITISMLVFDIFSRFDGTHEKIYFIFNHMGNFLIFSLNLIIPSLWLMYVHFQVFNEDRKTKRLIYPLLTINGLNVIMVVLSQFFGWLYYIDSRNIYHRGPLFLLPVSIAVVLLLMAFLLITVNRKRIKKNYYFALSFFMVPPLLSIFLQIVYYGLSLMLNSVVLSLLIVFLIIQNRDLYIDYLTGVYNRKKFESYLKEKISKSSENKTFSAIMIDLNDFKSINDNFGHDMGDKALQTSARLLSSCLKSNDFIARFGGDEFCIILDISNRLALETFVCKINRAVDVYNKHSDQPYNLNFSIGYKVYDFHSNMTVEEFQKEIDILMYENKQTHKKLKCEQEDNDK